MQYQKNSLARVPRFIALCLASLAISACGGGGGGANGVFPPAGVGVAEVIVKPIVEWDVLTG
ncbi:MAG: efflux transporter periplasmic adaptor subunit, partial [Pseudomonadota bacterium]